MNWQGRSRNGSVCLEAALTLPIVLLLGWFLLSQLIAVTAEIKLAGAVRRTAAELSLAGPAASLMETALTNTEGGGFLEDGMCEVDRLMASLGFSENLLESLAADCGLSLVLGPLVCRRITFWLDDAAVGQPGHAGRFSGFWRPTIQEPGIWLDWQPEKRQLWICLSWQQRHAFGCQQKYLQQVVPLWTGRDGKETISDHSDDAVWQMDNFSRGQTFRERLGANLPYDFPVIARFSEGTATAVKSIDLTAPTYDEPSAFQARLSTFIDDLAAFRGASQTRDGTTRTIQAHEIERRRLVLVVPQNSDRDWLDPLLGHMVSEAARYGVVLEVSRRGHSSRYS